MLLYFSFVLFSPSLSCESEMHDMLLITNNVLHGSHNPGNIMEIQKCDICILFCLVFSCCDI